MPRLNKNALTGPPGWQGAPRLLSTALLCACLASVQPAAQAAPIVGQDPASPQVNGTLYLSVPAAAFHPKWLQYYDYINNGDFLIHKGHTYGAPGIYYAPLQLPHLATITKVTFYYFSADVDDGHVLKLVRTLLTEGSIPTMNILAELHSIAGDGSDEITLSETVDNNGYGYFFEYTANITNAHFYRVLVEYTLPGGTPVPEKLDIAPACYVPFMEGLWIENGGNYVKNFDTVATSDIQAPVLLPRGHRVECEILFL